MINISVCIPVYNVAPYIAQCARSLFEQTMKEGIEFIFVDDCSVDDSINILRSELKAYPNRELQVRILKQPTNRGVSAARTLAFQNAKGKYILCCDADDYIDLDYCEKLFREAEKECAEAVIAGYIMEFSRKQTIVPAPRITGGDSAIALMLKGLKYSTLSMKLIRTDILRIADEHTLKGITMGEDLMLSGIALKQCRKIASVSDTWYHYRQVRTSKVHRYARKDIDQFMSAVHFLEQNLSQPAESYDNLKLQYICMGAKARLLSWNEIINVRRQLCGLPRFSCYYGIFGWKRASLLLLILRMPVVAHVLYRVMKCCHS